MTKTFHIFSLMVLMLGVSLPLYAQPQPARLRVLSLLPVTSAQLTITNKDTGQQDNLVTRYAEPTEYLTLTPARYQFSLFASSAKVLASDMVLGADGMYTLLIIGLLPEQVTVNQQTTLFKLKKMLGGETPDTNDFLPQWRMLRDNYDGSKNAAYVRFINANPSASSLSLTEQQSVMVEGLSYPHVSRMVKSAAGEHTMGVKLGAVNVSDFPLTMVAGYIYTLVTGPHNNNPVQLKTVVLENKSKALLH